MAKYKQMEKMNEMLKKEKQALIEKNEEDSKIKDMQINSV